MVSTILSVLLTLQTSIISINDLVTKSHEYDNQAIVIEAEVILEVLERGDYAWINVNDGSNAIGVYVTMDMIKDLDVFGNYNHRGDIVRVNGVFTRNCDEHGGEIDIHATSIEIVEEGYKITEEISGWKFIVSIIGLTLSAIAIFVYRSLRKNKPEEE